MFFYDSAYMEGAKLSLALARKYRPSTFDDLVGQDAVSQTLSLALDSDRLSHAYLFSGLRGSGKTSTARIFAKALLCEKGPSSKPCNTCDHCVMANESRHMDIIEMDAASNRGIDDIKELIEHTKYKPGTGRFKIFIIDEVHMLTTQAFNALLKTLEEPPDFVKFILATTDPLKLPATILSRTQHFRFKKIPQKLVVNHLQHILEIEKIDYSKEALEIIARSGAGSLRDALTLLDQAIVYSKNHVDVATVTGMLGIIEPSLLDGLLEDIQARDEAAILSFIRQAGTFETEMIVDELTLHLKELLLSKDRRFSPMVIDRFFRILADAKTLLGLGSDGEFVLSLTLFKMMEALRIREVDDMIRTLQKELSGVKTSAATSTMSAPPNEKVIDVAAILPESTATSESSPSETPDTHASSPAAKSTMSPGAPAQETPGKPSDATHTLQFAALLQKIYDRDYDLGSCFERNITFDHFRDHTLTWISTAKGEEKKTLIRGWSIIKIFVQEIFGFDTRIVNVSSAQTSETTIPKKKTDNPLTPPPETGSMIEAVELSDSSNSRISPDHGATEADREKDPSVLLQEPMVKEMIELFQPRKVRIVQKS